jgi:hypothetical protein
MYTKIAQSAFMKAVKKTNTKPSMKIRLRKACRGLSKISVK